MPSAAAPQKHTACLLIHGFGGSPFEMEPLVPALEASGASVDLPVLPGHDADIASFRQTLYPDWFAHAEERFLKLASRYESVIPVGFSMGACIALSLAAKHAGHPSLKGVAALAPAWRIYRPAALSRRTAWLILTPFLRHFIEKVSLPPPKPESRAIAPFRGYDRALYLPQLHSLARGVADMRRLLPELNCPLLLMSEAHDKVCPPDGALHIARAVSSFDVRFRLLRMRETVTSHHMLTTHQETRDAAAAAVAEFVERVSGEKAL